MPKHTLRLFYLAMGAVGGVSGAAVIYLVVAQQLNGDFVKPLWLVGPPLLLMVALFVLAARQVRKESQDESRGSNGI